VEGKLLLNIEEYIILPLEKRQGHLRLNEPCIERGGTYSVACHACHNAKCSNPCHLYWGTPKENWQDGVASGKIKSCTWEGALAKYGSLEKLKQVVHERQREARIAKTGRQQPAKLSTREFDSPSALQV
jgi:hypothetical protein